MLQDFQSVSDHYGRLCIKGFKPKSSMVLVNFKDFRKLAEKQSHTAVFF